MDDKYKNVKLKKYHSKLHFGIWKDKTYDLWYLAIGLLVIREGTATQIKKEYNKLIGG